MPRAILGRERRVSVAPARGWEDARLRALLSVANRDGITGLARDLLDLGVEIYATDGTREHLADDGVEVGSVSELTAFQPSSAARSRRSTRRSTPGSSPAATSRPRWPSSRPRASARSTSSSSTSEPATSRRSQGTALTLIGERPATARSAPMEPWGAHSALPFMSSSALTVGRSCLALDELTRLERASSVIYMLSFLALDGNPSAFSSAAARAAAAPHVETVATRLRSLFADDRRADRSPARIQDPYGLRVYPVAQASVVASLDSLVGQLERTLNTAQENPLFDVEGDEVVHHGAFYQASLSLELDGTTLALALTAPITHSRIRMLNDPDTNGGNAFLAADSEGSSGLMMVEYVAAGAIAEIRNAAQPASVGTLVLSRGAEEDATFASQGALQLERSVAAYRVLLCCELVGAVRLLRQRRLDGRFAGVLGEALALTADLPREDNDRDLRGDLTAAEVLLDDLGRLVPDDNLRRDQPGREPKPRPDT